jgi:hypothetical protein
MEQTRHEKNLSTKQHQTKTDTWIFDPDGNSRRTQRAQAPARQRKEETYGHGAAETG